jgi:hypothetical protein
MVMPTTTNTYAYVLGKPYCDLLDDVDEEDRPESCHDRYDFYEGGPNNGLFPYNDGSNRNDPKDCPDISGFDYSSGSSDDDSGGSNPDGEDADQNCGGEPCTDDEKEDSWTEDEGEVGAGLDSEDALFGS